MKIPFFQVDSFAIKPFRGNPAGVVLLESARDDNWMQSVAQEVNLSETAFLCPKGHDYELRWFTPTIEVDLCGHATLASAHILYEFGYYDPDETINFFTRSGTLTSVFKRGTIELDMPRLTTKTIEAPQLLGQLINCEPVAVSETENGVLLVELPSPEMVQNFVPDYDLIAQLDYHDFAITSSGTGTKFDFVSRFFSPKSGIPEDPVTGMAHCFLGDYWSEKLGKEQFIAYQSSARGGQVWVRLEGNRAHIGGKAITVIKGDFLRQSD